jgi:hypothetical protein
LDLAAFSAMVGMDKPLGGTFGGRYGRVTVNDRAIEFGDGALQGQGTFSGDWAVTTLRIEDPFGPDTSYQVAVDFSGINLRQMSRYIIDANVTRHGVIHGTAAGKFNVKMLHNGEPETFEVWLHAVKDADKRQYIDRDAARALVKLFVENGAALAEEMKQLANHWTYTGLALYARMDLDQMVRLRGGYYRLPPYYEAAEYTYQELHDNVVKAEDREYILLGSGVRTTDISKEMYRDPIPWSKMKGRVGGE